MKGKLEVLLNEREPRDGERAGVRMGKHEGNPVAVKKIRVYGKKHNLPQTLILQVFSKGVSPLTGTLKGYSRHSANGSSFGASCLIPTSSSFSVFMGTWRRFNPRLFQSGWHVVVLLNTLGVIL